MKSKVLSYSGWTAIWLLAFYFIYSNALRYFNPSSDVWTPELIPFAPFLVIHVAGGMVALIIGPLQFFSSLRRMYPRIHRVIGRIYLLSVLISASASVYLAVFDNWITKKGFMFATGALGMALAWYITAGMAYYAIKNRNFNQHKEWMIRSYVLTSNFIIFRLIFYGLLGIDSFPFKDDAGDFTVWAGWSIPLLITEWILQARKIVPKKRKGNAALTLQPRAIVTKIPDA
jgi:uncharacterized membrane protein